MKKLFFLSIISLLVLAPACRKKHILEDEPRNETYEIIEVNEERHERISGPEAWPFDFDEEADVK